jgi:hypothetical protein
MYVSMIDSGLERWITLTALVVGIRNSGDDDASDGPAHLQRCCACTP